MTLDEMIENAVLVDGPSAVPTSRISPGGIDPLGLRQINFGLMDQVFPNLNNVARRLRPFVVLAWAWRRVAQVVNANGHGGDTDERLRDFVDRIETIYIWSQFLLDPSCDLPGGQALLPLIGSESYRFGGEAWITRRNLRRSSTGLISPLNYGPGLKMMGWLEPVGPAGVFRPNPIIGPAIDAFEETVRDELDHPAFSMLGEVVVQAKDVRRWGSLWQLDAITKHEQDVGFDRLAGEDAPVERRRGLALVLAAHAGVGKPHPDTDELRRWMAALPIGWTDDATLVSTATRWTRVQVRQVFRLALEGLLHWVVGRLIGGPLTTAALAEAFLSELGEEKEHLDAAAWLEGYQATSHPADHLDRLSEALATNSNVAAAIAEALAFSLREGSARREIFERSDRLPIAQAAGQARRWGGLPPESFVGKVLETWVFAQHTYWCVGRGLADARGGGKMLLRLKVVMDEGGWTLTPGTNQGIAPVATRDRLDSALGLLRDCGRLD